MKRSTLGRPLKIVRVYQRAREDAGFPPAPRHHHPWGIVHESIGKKPGANLACGWKTCREPTIGINDVLIRVQRTGICGTDVHIYKWDEWAQKTIPVPMAIGHEFVGEIVEVGSNVTDFHPGDIVSGEGHVVCGRCRNCLAGRRHLCAHTRGRRRRTGPAPSPSTSRCP